MHSDYSLLDSCTKFSEYVDLAVQNGQKAIASTEHGLPRGWLSKKLYCDKMGINVFELIRLANCHPRVNILNPGVGVGGHCIAVDPWFIYEQFPEEAKVIHASRLRNENKPRFVAGKVLSEMKKVTDTVLVLGLAYKPDVDDLRESPSIELCHLLAEKGVKVIACEPFAPTGEVAGIPNLPFEEAMAQADFVVVTLGHSLFKENMERIREKPHYDCVGMMS